LLQGESERCRIDCLQVAFNNEGELMRRVWWFVVVVGLWAPLRLFADEPTDKLSDNPPAAEVKAAFRKLLDRPKIDVAPQTISGSRTSGGLITEHLSIATERKGVGAESLAFSLSSLVPTCSACCRRYTGVRLRLTSDEWVSCQRIVRLTYWLRTHVSQIEKRR
jgi:hypothetical protein